METIEIIAQSVSIAGLLCIVASYQQKKKSALILCQLAGGALFGIHYLLMGAYTGFLLNCIAVFRALVFYKGTLSPKAGKIWVCVFIALSLLAYGLTFLAFGTEPSTKNLILELLPVIGMVALSISFNMTGTREIRALGTISSVGWLIFNIAKFSIGGIACEGMCLVSIVIGILRHDIKKENK